MHIQMETMMDIDDEFETELDVAGISNRSLLLEMLDIGSGDIIPMIFQFVTSLKEKVRLERVCRRFREHALTYKAWSNIQSIRIEGDDSFNHYLFNDDLILAYSLSPATESILWHCQNVRYIDMVSCRSATVYSLVAQSMTDDSSVLCETIERLSLNGLFTPDVSAIINSMIDAVKSQLIDLQLVDILFDGKVEMHQLWTTIGKCLDLKIFKYNAPENIFHGLLTLDLVKAALRGKAIQWFQLDEPNIKATELVEIVSVFADGNLLHSLQSTRVGSLIPDFVEKLPLHLNHICLLEFFYCGRFFSDSHSSWSTILHLPLMCPELVSLSFKYDYIDITSHDVVTMIVSYLDILNKRADQGIEFKLTLNTEVLDIDCWKAVFTSLTNNHQCYIQPSCEGSFRICRGEQSQILLYCDVDSRDIF